MNLNQAVEKFVLENAVKYNGKANPKAVIGSIIKAFPDARKDMKKLVEQVNKKVESVNKLSVDKQKKLIKDKYPELLEEKEKVQETGLKDLPGAEKRKLVVRIAPSPSGPLHIGHAYGASLNYEYAKKYKGKFIVRIEDTNPVNIYPPAYDLIKNDCSWLVDNDKIHFIIQSDRLTIYHKHAETLVREGKAYVCTCDADKFRELKAKGTACPCRGIGLQENENRYLNMFKDYAEGEAVVRFKTDIKHKNPAMRDFPIMRICEHIHPLTKNKHRVWPLMIFGVAIDDHELGMTHVLNGKDHADNAKKEALIMKALGWEPPIYKHWGRINFEGFELSSSKTKIKIEEGEFSGWDDIRLPFLPALRRRGLQAGAIRKFAVDIGLSLNDKSVSQEEFWKIIDSFNKEIIDPIAKRYFVIRNSVKITVRDAPDLSVELDLHPDNHKGGRNFKTQKEFYIEKDDLKDLEEDDMVRLMSCLNFTKTKDTFLSKVQDAYIFNSEDYETYKKQGKKIIHWLPVQKDLANIEVIMPDKKIIKGLGEPLMKKLKEGDIIQAERFGFMRLDKKQKDKLVFWFTHQ